jgi:hypothetical protein
VSLDQSVMTEDELKRRLAVELFENPGGSQAEILAEIKDSVSYTVQFEAGRYAGGVLDWVQEMRSRGFELAEAPRNTWGGQGYQGINSFWRDPHSRHLFQVQFHTPDSLAARDAASRLYERQRLPGISPDEAARLRQAQEEIFRRVPVPRGAADLRFPPAA